jgi:UDP-N-acetylglucosamine--N-acetylmuramyl-(pentapeptide) pyrophosphoryl-undecaprenol N-acetylglucosamine transferase
VRVVIAGGGTGGHTSAGLAVAAELSARGVECAWIGSRQGVEATRVPRAQIQFEAIPTGKLRRYWSWENLTDLLLRVPAGLWRAFTLLRRLRPDAVFATGGFVAVPVVLAAAAQRIPIVIHEQTAVPGLANRLGARVASTIALTFPGSGAEFPATRCVVTGNPIRQELRRGVRERALERFEFDPARPIVYVTGGALGAHRINRVVGEALPELLDAAQVIHQCGDNQKTGDLAWLRALQADLPGHLRRRYRVTPYVGEDLGDIYAAAQLVVGRAGAGTVSECCHLGLPALYIPLPGARGDEQTANARFVEAAGGCALLPEASLAPGPLVDNVRALLAAPERLKDMGERAQTLARPDAARRIADLIVAQVARGGRP